MPPWPLLMLCKFTPSLSVCFLSCMLYLVALGTMLLLSMGVELVLVGGLWWVFLSFCGGLSLSLESLDKILMRKRVLRYGLEGWICE